MNKKVLVTGAKGQLGKTIEELYSKNDANLEFTFVSKDEIDITNEKELKKFFKANKYDYCINCAAYTNVEQSEKTPEIAYKVNAEGVKNLAEACKESNTVLIHISTDYVFDGKKNKPYFETDIPNPLNVYGSSKLKGEQHIKDIISNYFIIRASWLYSRYGNNFVRNMLRLSSEREELSVVSDQIGTPTSASDLASVIIKIIKEDLNSFGIYNYSNAGEISWYDFGKTIFDLSNVNVGLQPILSVNYPTLAKRPYFSVLNTNKIKQNLQIQIPYWKDSLIKDLE